MTATERLRALLDERGIKWHRSNGEHGMVIWERDGLTYSAANAWPRNDDTRTKLVLHVSYPTPEQAIAATIGSGYGITFAPTFERPPESMVGECVYDEDGNHIGWITAATVGAGTCKLVDNEHGPDMHCTACGGGVDDEYRYFMDSWGYSRCPHCGARIEGYE